MNRGTLVGVSQTSAMLGKTLLPKNFRTYGRERWALAGTENLKKLWGSFRHPVGQVRAHFFYLALLTLTWSMTSRSAFALGLPKELNGVLCWLSPKGVGCHRRCNSQWIVHTNAPTSAEATTTVVTKRHTTKP